MTYLLLFYEFFKVGLFAVGGGLATIPFLNAIADKYDWFDRAMLIDMIAVGESTPGPIGVNMATYAGFQAAGIPGGIFATFALVLPAFILGIFVAKALTAFSTSPAVKGAFYGLRPAVTGMIAAAGLSVAQVALLRLELFSGLESLSAVLNLPAIVLFVVLYVLFEKFKKHPVFYIAAGAAVGILLQM